MSTIRRLAAAAFAIAALPAPPALAVNENPHASAFVVTYRCDGEDWLAVAYPAPFARATVPVRLSWNGATVVMSPARSGSGARYVSRAADLAWWNQGHGGTLYRLSDRATLLANCVES
ncbi:MAG: MliC family protein [Burkholderiales bacterium]|jgi:membrane-bound inhibitor of C-type lysozyme|nr:MliC family protein [Burkholderiales bacterium]